MSVTGASNRVDYTGDGSNPTFTYSFPVYTQSDLTVYITPSGGTATLKTLGADYTQSAINLPGGVPGGSIVFNTPPPASSLVSLIRVVPTTQPNSYTNLDKFDAKSAIEFAFDRIVMMCQQLLGTLGRCLTWPVNATSASLVLPDPTVVANQGLFLEITAGGLTAGTPVTASFTNPLTTKGDLMASPGGATPVRVGVGSDGQTLEADSTQASGLNWKQGLRSLVTTAGDMIYATGAGVFARLAKGSGSQFLGNSGGIPTWVSVLGQSFSAIGADVNLNNTGTYFDGPSTAAVNPAIYLAVGQVTVEDTAGSAVYYVKLWDGTTVFASGMGQSTGAANPITITLSAIVTNPVANVRLSVRDATSTSGLIKFNYSGNSLDSRINMVKVG